MNPTAAEIREHVTTWPTWQRDLWLGCLWFCFVLIAYAAMPPAERPWLVSAIAFSIIAGLLAWGLDLRRDLRAARRLCDALDDQLDHADAIIRRQAADVLEAQGRAWDAEHVRPGLYVVPEQRDGSHDDLPVADGHFPVHTEINTDDIEALMRATEEK